MWKWIRRIAIGTGLLVLLLVVAGVVIFQSDWLRDRLRQVAMTQADKQLTGALTIGTLKGSLLHGVELDDVALTQADGSVFSAKRVIVMYDVMTLIHKHLVLDSIVLDHPNIRIAQTDAGWNVGHVLKTKTPAGKPLDFQIQRLQVLSGDVMVIPATAASRHLEDVNADAALSRLSGAFAVTLTSASLHDDTSGFDVTELATTLKDGLKSVGVQFAARRGVATIGGRAQLSSLADGVHLDASANLSHVNLRSLLIDPKWQSDVTAQATVKGLISGRADDTAITFAVKSPHSSAFGYEGDTISATGEWAKGVLAFDASAHGYGADATMKANWRLSPSGTAGPAFEAQGGFTHVALPALPATLKMPPLESNLAGRYTLRFGEHAWRASVILNESTVEGGTVAAGTTGFLTSRPGLTTYSAAGHVANMDLRRLSDPLVVPTLAAERYRSQLTGDFAISGQELCHGCDVPRVIIASAQLGSAAFSDADVTGMVGTMTLVGSRLSVTGNGQVAHLSAEALGIPLTSTFDLNGHVDGSFVMTDLRQTTTMSNVEASGTAELSASTVAGVALDSTSVTAILSGGTLTATSLKATGAGLKIDATGALALAESGASDFTVAADSDDLAPLGQLLKQPFAGAGHVEAHVTGPYDQPSATGKVSLRSVAYGSDASALTFNSDLTATMPGWDPAQATVSAKGSATFIAMKSLTLTEATATVTYHAHQLDLDADLMDTARELKVAGALTFEPEDRALQVHTLSLATKGQIWTLPEGQEATVRMSDARLKVQKFVLQKGTTSVSADGEFSLNSTTTAGAGLAVKVSDLQLADINQLLLGERQLSGLVNAQMTVTGTTTDPAVQGHIEVTGGKVQTTPFESFKGDVRLAAHDLTLDATLVQSGANTLKASGHVPVGAGALTSVRPMEVKITSTPIDLGLAQLLTESITKVAGTAEVNVTLTGTPQAPVVDGTVKVDNGQFTVQGTGVGYDKVTAALTFEKNHLAINALELHDDDGHVMQATGGVDLLGDAAKRAFDVKITSHSIHMLNNELGTLQVNADLEISGDFAAPKVTGRIALDSGRLQVDQILEKTTKSAYSTTAQSGLVAEPDAPVAGGTAVSASGDTGEATAKKQEAAVAAAAPPGLMDRVIVDLTVHLPDNLVMRGRGLRIGSSAIGLGDINIIAGGDMHIVKAAGGSPTVVGDVQIVRGTYSFQGRRFDVERGSSVGFHGNDVTNPSLDVSADRDVNGISATVHVKGTAKDPQINLSSQPPLDEAEILSLIVFGQSLGDLGQGQRTSLAASAGAMAAGTITTPLADSVANALDLDTFEILAPSDTESLPVVSLGSTIGSRVYVGVKREIGGDASAVSFEYRFTRFLRLVTSFAQGALEAHTLERTEAGGIDLLFVFRY